MLPLAADGFAEVEVFAPQRTPDGNFPNVPGHVSNPENPKVYAAIIERAKETGADLVLVTDPDADRIGIAAPQSLRPGAAWVTFTGNQIGALLTEFVLANTAGLTPQHYLVKTLVTTEMIRRIGQSYGVPTHGDVLVGFKYIGGTMDDKGPDKFLLGLEESHGYLAGQYARDKDGALAAMLIAEAAAQAKAAGKSVYEKLEDLFWQHGYHAEHVLNLQMEGSEGMGRMKALMQRFRDQPPQALAGIPVAAVRDYQNLLVRTADGTVRPLAGPQGDLVMLDLAAEGNYVAVRPSGTEPKVKFYMFTFVPAEQLADLEQTRHEMTERLDRYCADLKQFADAGN